MIGGLCAAGAAAGLAAAAGLCPAPAGASFGIAGLCPAPAGANGVCCTGGGAVWDTDAGLDEPDFLV